MKEITKETMMEKYNFHDGIKEYYKNRKIKCFDVTNSFGFIMSKEKDGWMLATIDYYGVIEDITMKYDCMHNSEYLVEKFSIFFNGDNLSKNEKSILKNLENILMSKKYKDDIIFTSTKGKSFHLCFSDYEIRVEKYYKEDSKK